MKNFEALEPCTICGISGKGLVCFHHLKHRSSGGGNEPFNLVPLCKAHHVQVHYLNKTSMAMRYPQFENWLKNHGWYFCNVQERWKHG